MVERSKKADKKLKDIKVLDCTLRDGGYINDWRFGRQAISDILSALEKSGSEIVEVGFLRDVPYQEDRVIFNSMEQVKSLIGKKQPNIKYAVMAAVADHYPLELLAPADNDSADLIRVIIWKTQKKDGKTVDALEEAYDFCKGIVERGYPLCVQPARVNQYSDDEFVSMIRRFSELNPYGIYVVDSWGTQTSEEMLHYMHLADDNMSNSCALGYHGHNNMMQAQSIAQAMLWENFNREIMIDASIYGIGRGAGNLNLELIETYLNKQYGKKYDVLPLLDIYENHIKKIYEIEPWGYSVPFYLTAQYNGNPNFARYLGNQLHLNATEIRYVLSKLTENDRIIYNKSAADKLLEEYRAGDFN